MRQRDVNAVKWEDPWIKRAAPTAPFSRTLSGGMQYSSSLAPARGVSELLDSYRGSGWLQAVVNRIGYHFAIVPWLLHERPSPDNPRKRMQTRKYQAMRGPFRHKSIGGALRIGELAEVEEHPLLDLLNQPNPQMGGVAFRDLCCKFVDFTGECFQLVVRDGLGIPYQLWPLSPTWVTRIPTSDEPTYEFSILGHTMEVPTDEVIYIRRHELLNPFARGTGIGVSLGDTIDLDAHAHKFLKSFYYNGARPDMIISLPGASEDVIGDFQMKFENQTRGALRAHRTFFADDDIKVTELKNDVGAKESLPLLNHVRDTFISVYGVPPEIMGVLENSNRATINQAMTIFARETLMPRLELFNDEWQRQLVPLFDDRLLLSYANPVPEDEDFRLDVARAAPWSLSAREWRQLGGWNSTTGEFDFYMVPVGLTATDDPANPILAPGQPGVGFGGAPSAPSEPAGAPAEPAAKSYTRKSPEDEAARVMRAFDPDYLGGELGPVWQQNIGTWGDAALDALNIDARFDMQNPRVKEHLKTFAGSRIRGINETTQEGLRQALIEGFKNGDGYEDMADRVRGVMDVDGGRAENIARTEITRSSNFASFDAYKQSGVVEKKQWIGTVSDDRTRDEHAALNGQVVGIDDDFTVGSARAAYPGDFGDPALDCMCRCAVGPVVDEPKSGEALTAEWKAYDAKARAWEKQAAKALSKAWSRQQSGILGALRAVVD